MVEDRLAEALGDLRVAVHTALWRNLGDALPDPLWITEALRNEQDEAVAFAIVRDRLTSSAFRPTRGRSRSEAHSDAPKDSPATEISLVYRLGSFLRRAIRF